MDSKSVNKNRAKIDKGDKPFKDCTDSECCQEELVFAMKDNYHDFSIGLSTILQCIALAEKEGYVPKLPDEWWNAIRRY